MSRQQDALPGEGHRGGQQAGQVASTQRRGQLGQVRLELLNAGFRSEHAVAVFYGLKILAR